MTFRPDVKLDPGEVRDVRGRRVRGGGVALGGGLGTIVIIVLLLLFGGNLGDLGGLGLDPGSGAGEPVSSELEAECQTGADANERQDCRIVGTVNSLHAYWADAFAASNQQFSPPEVVLFTDAVNTQCGAASSAVGPFYCPLDQTIYIDLGFYDQLESQFGAEGGPFAEEYVLAHEYGHHVQNLLGYLQQGQEAGAEGTAVRTELQADCFAGVWGGNAAETGFLQPITQAQLGEALNAAQVIGDDRIQEQTQGQVNRETWTHGSSEQRQTWFTNGYEARSADACDTFNADI
jgi:predicted metalloprotease